MKRFHTQECFCVEKGGQVVMYSEKTFDKVDNETPMKRFMTNQIVYSNGELVFTSNNLRSIRFPAKAYERKELKSMNFLVPLGLLRLESSFALVMGNVMLEFLCEDQQGAPMLRYVPFQPELFMNCNLSFKVFPCRMSINSHVEAVLKAYHRKRTMSTYQYYREVVEFLVSSLSEQNATIVIDSFAPKFVGKITRNSSGQTLLHKLVVSHKNKVVNEMGWLKKWFGGEIDSENESEPSTSRESDLTTDSPQLI